MAHTIRILGGDLPRQYVTVQCVMRLKRRQRIDATTDIRRIVITKRSRWGQPHRFTIELEDGRKVDAEGKDAAIGQLVSWSGSVGRTWDRQASVDEVKQATLSECIGVFVVLGAVGWGIYSACVWLRNENNLNRGRGQERISESNSRHYAPSSSMPHVANDAADSELEFDGIRADRGQRLFEDTIGRYTELDDFYSSVDKRNISYGFPANLGLPAEAWEEMGSTEREDIGHFLSRESPINGWRVVVGAIDGSDILADRTAMTSSDWKLRKEPDSRYAEVSEQRERQERERSRHRALAEGERGIVTGMAKVLLYGEAREFVRGSLRDPSDARFASASSDPAVFVERRNDQVVVVRGWVDSKNGLGTKIRTHWIVTMRPTAGGSWVLEGLEHSP